MEKGEQLLRLRRVASPHHKAHNTTYRLLSVANSVPEASDFYVASVRRHTDCVASLRGNSIDSSIGGFGISVDTLAECSEESEARLSPHVVSRALNETSGKF